MNLGALAGGICFGALSERLGRKRAIMLAAALALPMIPLWAWSHTAVMLAVGGFLMQFLSWTTAVVAVALILVTGLGPEAHAAQLRVSSDR